MKKSRTNLATYLFLFLLAISSYQYAVAQATYIKNYSDFPAFPYNTTAYKQSGAFVGCGPTTGSMIFAYFDHVNGSNLLTDPVSGTNEGLNTAWALHGSSYMKTGANGFGNVYDIKSGLENYATDKGYTVKALIHVSPTYSSSSTSWAAYGTYGDAWVNDGSFWHTDGTNWWITSDDFCDFLAPKLAAGITIFLTIDTDMDGSGDHWVPLVGYNKSTGQYAFYDTYSTTVKWANIHYCGASGPKQDNAISFLRSVEYQSTTGQQPPTELTALDGYNGAVPLAWNAPSAVAMSKASGQLTSSILIDSFKKQTTVSSSQSDIPVPLEMSPDLMQKYDQDLSKRENISGQTLPATIGLQGYNVYRTTSSGGVLGKIASNIQHQYYRDETVVNGVTYYYKVKAVYDEGESDFSNEASAQAQTDGYTIMSGWTTTSPTIDGVINSSEWSSAKTTDITYPGYIGNVTLYVMNSNNKLYMAVDDGRDNSQENLDQFALFFDEDLNREWPTSAPSEEGVIWIAWDASNSTSFSVFGGRYGYWPDNIGLEANVTTPGVNHGMSLTSDHVQYEGSYDLSSSPINASAGDIIGILMFVYDYDPQYFNAFWPQQVVELEPITPYISGWGTAPFSFGDLKLASATVAAPDISVNPTSWDYGTVTVGGYSDKTFVVLNNGSTNLNVTSITTSGDVNQFSVQSGDGSYTMAPGETRNVVIRFSPTSTGSKSVTANINSNDPDENPLHVTLTGEGGQSPVLHVNPVTLNFGTSAASSTFQVSNFGGSTLNWNAAESPDKTWITSVSPASGSNDATVTVNVDRSQLSGNSDTGTIAVTSNGGNQNVTVNISKEEGNLPDRWDFTSNTGNSATVVLPTTANPNVDGTPLADGDYIGVFTPAGLCCGHSQWQGQNISVTVWGDNDQTPAIDGFQGGELISYRVYRTSEQKEWSFVTVDYSQGTGNYSTNGFMVLNQFDVSETKTISINFSQGWNMFSINVNPDDPDIETVMNPIVSKLMIVKNSSGQTYIPAYGINNIGDINYREGYQAYLNQAATLDVTGQPVDPTSVISLSAGWSIITYLPTMSMDVATALASISSQLVIAKNNDGQTYIPQYGINTIGQMQPGQAYQVYLSDSGTLIYPQTGGMPNAGEMLTDKTELKIVNKTITDHFQFTSNTGENATVVITTDIMPKYSDDTSLFNGDEIGVFTSGGLCCGAVAWKDSNTAITVWGDNSQTSEIDGFAAGDTLHFRVWKKSVDVEYPASVTFQASSPCVYKANGFSVLAELVADLTSDVIDRGKAGLPSNYKLCQNYPNPFNMETTIEYQVPKMSDVSLSIYDTQGHKVLDLAQGIKFPGNYKVKWGGKNSLGESVASGIYFYQIRIKSKDNTSQLYVDVRKMIIMK